MSKNIWRLIIDAASDQYYNMAVDEAIAKSTGNDKALPTLRFYRWNPPTLSLGYFQKFEKEVDPRMCQLNNIGIVRRITGGRAVLHDDEITYSLSIPSSNPIFQKDLITSYKMIAEALAEGLKLLNLSPSFNQKKLPSEHSSAACFDAPSLYELTISGKKIIGSAQKRFQNSFLQHGSIPFSINAEKLFNCFKIDNKELKNRLINNFKNTATGINDELGVKISVERAIDAFIKGFEKVFSIDFIQEKINLYESELVEKELYQKYSSEEWLKKY